MVNSRDSRPRACATATAAQEALHRSEERYRLLFERNRAGVYRSTREGQMLECNEAFAQIMGYPTPVEVVEAPPDRFKVS